MKQGEMVEGKPGNPRERQSGNREREQYIQNSNIIT
jgi:hypothetical protein